jgi:SAM-dependent methyltransferase
MRRCLRHFDASLLGVLGSVASSTVRRAGRSLPYMEPGELLRPILASAVPLDAEVVETFEVGDVQQTNLRLLTGRVAGKDIRMFVRICVPQDREGQLATLLLIPGGRGTFTEPTLASWIASTSGTIVCAPDWIGSGSSDGIPGIDPWQNAIYWETDDLRDTFQFHQLRALLRARDYLLSHERADPTRLSAMGASWGSFYSFLLGGLDARFTDLYLTYGCGFFDIETRALWEAQFKSMPPERSELWRRAFDPGRRAHLITARVFYQQATNDRYFGLAASMATWDRIRTPKRLLLAPNIDHDLGPYPGQDIAMLKAAQVDAWEEAMPELEAAWIPGTNEVEVTVSDDRQATYTVYYAAGDYTGWAGRHWHAVPVLRGHDGSLRAHIPVIDPARRIRFFAQADWGDPLLGASSRVEVVVPLEQGFDRKTAVYEPNVDLTSEPFWRQPFTSGTETQLELVEVEGRPRVAIQFANEGRSERAIYYGFEGDVATAAGYDTVAFSLLVPKAEDAAALSIILVTDYYSENEQVYAVPLESLGLDYTTWQHIELPFSHFAPHGVRIENYLHAYQPQLLPLTPQRLNGVGLMRTAHATTPYALISDIVLKRSPRLSVAGEDTDGDGVELQTSELVIHTDLDAETLRNQLTEWEPWQNEVVFSNGVRTSDLRKTEPFEYRPTRKWDVFQRHIAASALVGGRALDLGCMIGQYALMLGRDLEMEVVGIDADERHVAVASFLRDVSGLPNVSFRQADANHVRLEEPFGLVLLLDTLDYLRHPLLALENVYAMLAPDGYLALEVETYVSPDGLLSRFERPDPSTGKEWCFGRNVILELLGGCGFDRIEVIEERPSEHGRDQNVRTLSLVARKPALG